MIFNKYKTLIYFSLLICIIISGCNSSDPNSTTAKNEYPIIERNGDWLRVNNYWYNCYSIVEAKLDVRTRIITMEIARQYNSDVTIFAGSIEDCEIVFDILTNALVAGTQSNE